jgi:hypothetical protein
VPRLLQWWLRNRILRRDITYTKVLEECSASIFRVDLNDVSSFCRFLAYLVPSGSRRPIYSKKGKFYHGVLKTYGGVAVKKGQLRALSIVTESGFGGLEVACWPLVPNFASSHPAEAVGFLGRKKFSSRLPSERK